MLETFRKHHYVLMCLIAVAVIISFTFFFSPSAGPGQRAGSSQRVGSVYGRDFTLGEVEIIEGQRRIAGQLAQMAMDREGNDPVSQFGQVVGDLVNTAVTDEDHVDVDYPTNILVMRQECENLGIDVEREDLEKFIKDQVGAFRTNGKFDAKKLESFLTSGTHGDRPATESKLFATIRDVMLFQRLAQVVGSSFAPSPAETDAEYAQANQKTTAATVLIDKKAHEAQTVTDEEIQKFYDAEKAKKEAVAKPDDKTPLPAADPLVLSEEKRTVKYVITEAPKPPTQPLAPSPPPSLQPMENVTGLPEDQKKAKEEEFKKRQEQHTALQEIYTKALTDHSKAMEEHQKKVAETTVAKTTWLKNVAALCDAIVAEDRQGKSFDDLVKLVANLAPPAPAEPAPAEPAPKPADDPVKPAEEPAKPAEEPAKPVESPAVETTPEATPVQPVPDPCQAPEEGADETAAPKPADDTAKPADDTAKPADDTAKPADDAPTPADDAAKPAEDPANPAAVPADDNKPAFDPAIPAEPAKPEPFGVKTATFTAAAAPEDIKKFTSKDGDAAKIIFEAKLNDTETWIEGQDQGSYCFFQVTGIEPAALLPLDQVKQKITDKLKAEKVAAALKAAAESARSTILEEIKAGKSFTEAAAGKAMLTATMLPVFSKEKPLPPGTTNAQVLSAAITGETGMGSPAQAGLQAGEISSPLEVPEGLLLVYVEKKELPKHPEMEQQKKALVESRTFRNAAGKLPDFNGPGGIEAYMQAMQYFRSYGSPTNPVLKAWFASRRSEAQAVQ